MAGKTAVLAVRIISDAKGAAGGFNAAGGMLGKLGGVAAGVAAAVLGMGAAVTENAGDLQQSIGAVDTVFEKSAGQMHKWADGAATAVGLTKNEYNELGTLIGTQLANGGTAMDQLAPKTNELISLGADLSSMFGGSASDAVSALSSALKGERDPIERYGVSLKQAAIDAKAAELGFAKVGGSLSNEAQQAATLALITEQTAKAHGNFARETDTYAHQKQVAAAATENLATRLGAVLLPIMTAVFGWLNTTAMPILETVIAGVETFAGWIGPKLGAAWEMLTGKAAAAAPLLDGVGAVFGRVAGWAQSQLMPAIARLWATFQQAAAVIVPVVQDMIGRVMAVVGPMMPQIQAIFGKVGSIITGTLGLIGAGVTWFVGAVSWVWQEFGGSIMAVVQAVWGGLLGVISPVLDTIGAVIDTATAAFRGDWSAVWDGIRSIFAGVWRTIEAAVRGALGILRSVWDLALRALSTLVGNLLRPVVDWFAGIGGRIRDALAGVGDVLVRAGRAIIDGFLRGLKAAWDGVTSFIGGIGEWIAKNKGPLDYDRRLLVPAGQAIMAGLRAGLVSEMPALERVLGTITGTIRDGVAVDPSVVLTGAGGRRIGLAGGTVVNITVNGAVDARAVARQIRDLLTTDARVRNVIGLTEEALA